MKKLSLALLVVVLAVLLVVPAVSSASGKAAKPKLTVWAAASLNKAFPAMVPAFKAKYPQYKNLKFSWNFQGTDLLVAQIEQGAQPDVFAGASTKYGNELFSKGYIISPVNFCQNRLCVVVPKSNPAGIKTLADVAAKSDYVSIGQSAVPIGSYTSKVLDAMTASGQYPNYKATIMAKAVQCLNVTQVLGLVVINEVDAGFVYVSDASYAKDRVTKIVIPDNFQTNPLPTYPIASLTTTKMPKAAAAWIAFVMSKKGQKVLKSWGFLPKPVVTP